MRRTLIALIASSLVVLGFLGLLWLTGEDPSFPGEPSTFSQGGTVPGAGRDSHGSAVSAESEATTSMTAPAVTAGAPASIAAGGVLHGRVVDALGVGVRDATIFVRPATLDPRDDARRRQALRDRVLGRGEFIPQGFSVKTSTDDDGGYGIALAEIPPGTYQLLASHSDFLTDTHRWTRTTGSSRVDFELGEGGHGIEGIVLSDDGTPVVGASVEARASSRRRGPFGGSRDVADRAETDADGRFVLRVLSGSFEITATAQGFTSRRARDVLPDAEFVEIVLSPGPRLVGRVVDASGEPVAGVRVSVLAGARPRGTITARIPLEDRARFMRLARQPQARVESDDDGRFEFSSLVHSSFTVFADKEGYVSAVSEGKVEAAREDPSSAQVHEITIQLNTAVPLSGIVVDEDGKAVPQALVVFSDGRSIMDRWRERRGGDRRPNEPLSLRSATTATEADDKGRFRVADLAAGTYSFSVQAPDFVSYREADLELVEEEELTIVLKPGVEVQGRVTASGDGGGVAGATVRFELSRRDVREARADDDGHYRLSGLEPGTVRQVVLDAPGYAMAIEQDVDIADNPEGGQLDFQLVRSATVGGVVVDGADRPVTGARLRIAPEVERSGRRRGGFRGFRRQAMQTVSTRSGPQGEFFFDDVSVTTPVRVTVQHADYKPLEERLEVASGAEMNDLRLVLQPGARLEVWLADAEGGAIGGARVEVRPAPEEDSEAVEPPGGSERAGRRGRGFGGRGDGGRRGRFGRGGGGRWGAERGETRRSTGPDGRAVFSSLSAGTYWITATRDGYQSGFGQMVAVEGVAQSARLELRPENAVSGVVYDGAGNSIASVEVRAERTIEDDYGNERRERVSTRTREDGTFRVGRLGPGSYTLELRRRGFASESLEDVEVNTEVSVVLAALGGVAGSVVVLETGEPVESFETLLSPKEGQDVGRRQLRRRWSQDDGGTFLLEELPAGPYTLRVTAEGFSAVETDILITEGEVREGVAITLEQGLAVSGWVVDASGQAVEDATVYLVVVEEPEADSGGDDGEEREGRRRARRDAREERREARRERDRQRQRRVERPEAEAHLAQTTLQTARRAGLTPLTTDPDGAFFFPGIEEGRYLVAVQHEEFLPAHEGITVNSQRVGEALRIELLPGERLSGTVRLEDSDEAAGVTVLLRDSGGFVRRVETDVGGTYEVGGLLPGTYWFTLEAGVGLRTEPLKVEVEEGVTRFDYPVKGGS